ncbi:hypothetical protein ACF0H5_021533 [Mactra antiquata]
MYWCLHILLVVSCYVSHVTASGSWCDDTDTVACLSLKQQKPDLCDDVTLGTQICPSLCNNCPLRCYSCELHEDSVDINGCNRITCPGKDKRCAYWFQPDTGIGRLTCADIHTVCESTSSVYDIKCCNTDFCNGNLTKTSSTKTSSTKPSSTKLTTTTTTTTRKPITTTTTTTPTTTTTLMKTPLPTTQVHTTSHHSTAPLSKTGVCKKDVIFMLSNTCGQVVFNKMKTFVKHVLGSLNVSDSLNHVGLGMFQQYHKSSTLLTLNRGSNLHACRSAVDSVTHTLSFGTSNYAAVRHLVRSYHIGNRPDVEDAVVIISNGMLPDYPPYEDLDRLHQMYPNVIVIAYGYADSGQLHNIATSADRYMYQNWGSHDSVLLQWLINKICS